jgi:hypothetical protein
MRTRAAQPAGSVGGELKAEFLYREYGEQNESGSTLMSRIIKPGG